MHKKAVLHRLLNPTFLAAMMLSTGTGWFVITSFLRYLSHGTLRPFVYYRVIFGIIVLALAIIRRPAG
jgi:undecaprenyl-diphosphatase